MMKPPSSGARVDLGGDACFGLARETFWDIHEDDEWQAHYENGCCDSAMFGVANPPFAPSSFHAPRRSRRRSRPVAISSPDDSAARPDVPIYAATSLLPRRQCRPAAPRPLAHRVLPKIHRGPDGAPAKPGHRASP